MAGKFDWIKKRISWVFLVLLLLGGSAPLWAAGETPDCSGTSVQITGRTFNSGETAICVASTDMQVGPGVVVSSGANVTLSAPRIVLKPGFHVKNMATFSAVGATVPKETYPNQAVLGPLSGSQINAYRLTDLTTPIEGPIDAGTSPDDLELAGTFRLSLAGIADGEWILVTAGRGTDIDPDDDGVADTPGTANQGTIHALAKASDWRVGGLRINALSEIAWREVAVQVQVGAIQKSDRITEKHLDSDQRYA